MERMTEKELQTLKELQAKRKRIEREEKKFLDTADERKEELLKRWGVAAVSSDNPERQQSDDLERIARLYYGITKAELYTHITSEQQVNFYKRLHNRE